MGFPPPPAYPLGIDNDRTLYKVYDTTEARLSVDNEPWSEILQIVPVAADKNEIWPDNGYATIEGEIFYYDSVERDINEKIYKLKGCIRNIGGEHTKWNKAGTWVRGFVMAEHHNQIVEAAINLEDYVDQITVKAQLLYQEPDCVDDHNCANVTFSFKHNDTLSGSCEGEVYDYIVNIVGAYTGYQIDFGDGNSSTNLNGQYTYAPNAVVNPIVTVTNNNCTTVQANNLIVSTPPPEEYVPSIPELPPIVCPECITPSLDLVFPPIVFPCLQLGDISIPDWNVNIPSIIEVVIPSLDFPSITFNFSVDFPDISVIIEPPSMPSIVIDVPTYIEIGPVNIPSVIFVDVPCDLPTFIEFASITIPTFIAITPVDIPSIIQIMGGASIPATIQIIPCYIPTLIVFDICPEIPTFIEFGPIDYIPTMIYWDTPPSLICSVIIICPSSPVGGGETPPAMRMLNDDFQDDFTPQTEMVMDLGIPSVINIVAPHIPDIKLIHNIPVQISIDAPEIPDTIKITGPLEPIPTQIEIVYSEPIPASIMLITDNVPTVIDVRFDTSAFCNIQLPVLEINASSIPTAILIDGSEVPTLIQVVGIPDTISISHDIPTQIIISSPKDWAIPLTYIGGPVPIQFDTSNLIGEDGETTCFALTPCIRK